MKGKLLRNKDLLKYNNKKVYVEFDVDPFEMTCCGDIDEHIKNCEKLQEQYPDKVYLLELDEDIENKKFITGTLIDINNKDNNLSLQFNLIDNIFEWIEE